MAVTPQDLANAELDIKTISEFVNGGIDDDVTNRAGDTFPSLRKATAAASDFIAAFLSGQVVFDLPDEANGDAIPAPGSGLLYLSAGVLKIA